MPIAALARFFHSRHSLLWVCWLTLTGCHGGYTYTFNDSVVYNPNENRTPNAGVLRDAALQACLNQYLGGPNAPSVLAEIKLLACPGSGVQTLGGIEALSGLEQLELSDNQVSDLSPLRPLLNLRVLAIRNNPIGDITVLNELPILRFISLQGNDGLPCSQVAALRQRLGNTLNAPLHCKE